MSNLSELLPAGAGAKSATFVASGTLGSGVTVALKSNGQVEAVTETTVSAVDSAGTPVVFEAASTDYNAVTFDSSNNKIIISYRDGGNSNYGTAVVGTVSGTSITFGTAVVFESASTTYTSCTYDSTNGKVVIAYRDGGNADYGTAIVGTVSGTSISFGTAVVFSSAALDTSTIGITYDSNAQKIVAAYGTTAGGYRGDSIVGTVSGTSISFGSPTTFEAQYILYVAVAYDAIAQKTVISYRDVYNSNYGTSIVGTVSGTSISFGTSVVFESAVTNYIYSTFDSDANKVVIAYTDNGNSNYGTAIVGTVSGTSISFGTAVVFEAAYANYSSVTYDENAQKVVIAYSDVGNSSHGTAIVGTVSGTSISFGTAIVFESSSSNYISSVYDANAQKVVISYTDGGNSGYGTSAVWTTGFSRTETNNTSFVGITDEAISSAASGSVVVQGGVPSSNAGAFVPFALSLGSEAVFESAGTSHIAPVYDTNAQKVVIAYSDNANGGYGTAVVGTVSGSGITFGTPVIFRSANTSRSISAAYDANTQKIVVAYSDVGRFKTGYILVGTVSGTSISFGSEATNNVSCNYLSVIYAPDVQKIVVSYQNEDSSFKATSIVGTVSGTSISFGTAALLTAGRANYVSSAYDTTNNRVVVSYQDQNNSYYGTAAVGTISGTSISFGTPVVFEAANSAWVSTTYNTAQQKIVISYQDNGNSNYGTAVVGTVSGTSISFATPVVFEAAEVTYTWAIYDPNSQNIVISYTDNGNSNYGTVVLGTVSGTSISFGTPIVFNAGGTAYAFSVYNTDLQKIVFTYRDDANSYYGTATVGTLSGGAFIPNTDYYVQTDGTLNTTVTTVPAGRALSTTSILLEG